MDELRRRYRRDRLDRQLAENVVLDLARVEHVDDLAARDLLRYLAPDRRAAFVLTQLFQLSYAEAAAVCECPVGTIRSRVARARDDLIELLGSERPSRSAPHRRIAARREPRPSRSADRGNAPLTRQDAT